MKEAYIQEWATDGRRRPRRRICYICQGRILKFLEKEIIITKFRVHHPEASSKRITLPGEIGGRGIKDVTNACSQQIKDLRNFFYQQNNQLHQFIVRAVISYTPLNHSDSNYQSLGFQTNVAKIHTWAS